MPSRVVIGHETQMEANKTWGSIDMGTHIATEDNAIIPYSHPYPTLVNDDGEGG